MGREIAEAVPAAREVYRVGRGDGPRSRRLCFDRRSTSSSRPRFSSRRSSRRASRSSPRCASGASSRTSSSGTRSASSRRSPPPVAGDGRGDRARARAGPRDGGGGPRAPGRDGSDPRPRRRGGREALPQDRRRVAGELQLPGPDRRLRRARSSRGVLRRGREPRRATSGEAEGLRRVPQPARREGGRSAAPALERVRFAEPLSPFMSTVTAKIEPAQRIGTLLVDQLTAPVRFTQAARELVARTA